MDYGQVKNKRENHRTDDTDEIRNPTDFIRVIRAVVLSVCVSYRKPPK